VVERCRAEGHRWQRQQVGLLLGETLGDGAPVGAALLHARIEPRQERRADGAQIGSSRDRHQLLPADPLASSLDAALVVARARTREARLDEIVGGELEEARRQLALAADEDARHRRF